MSTTCDRQGDGETVGGSQSSQVSTEGGAVGRGINGVTRVRKFLYNRISSSTKEWLGRSAVGILHEKFELGLVQFQLSQNGILMRITLVAKELICLLYFLDRKDKDIFVLIYKSMFSSRFSNVQTWEEFDLVKTNKV